MAALAAPAAGFARAGAPPLMLPRPLAYSTIDAEDEGPRNFPAWTGGEELVNGFVSGFFERDDWAAPAAPPPPAADAYDDAGSDDVDPWNPFRAPRLG